jgi:nucleotide-binding universal stress UspA family protein
MIKDIVVNLSVAKPRDIAGDFAISMAVLFEAHLSAVAFAYEPPVGGSIFDGVTPAFLDDWRASQKAEAIRTQRAFDKRASLAGISADSRVLSDHAPDAAYAFAAIARNYDLSVVAQAHPDDDLPEDLIAETALFDSGRPVLVVPYIQNTGINLDRVMVCWDGSRNAARAIGDAMPILKKAGRIEVVTVEQKERRNELRGAEIAEHLARHKLKVELNPIVAPDSEVVDVILSHAADNSIDFMVMGGYGHTRVREFVLGGVTRGMLGAMTLPVLMAH